MRVVIVGGVAGGASAAARLRRLDENCEIVMLERGAHISFANCGLPYFVGGEIEQRQDLLLQTPQSFHQRFRVDVRVNTEAMRIDRAQKQVEVKDLPTGQTYTLSYDKLILSPGALPIYPQVEGAERCEFFTLRNIPDAERIAEAAVDRQAKHALVVGAGFIGVEITENLCRRGIQTTLVDLADHVMPNLDGDIAMELALHLKQKGVDVRTSTAMARIETGENGNVVTLTDGSVCTPDIIVLCIGVRPDSRLAKQAGLALGVKDAIVVDESMRTSDPDIYAVGDAVQVKEFVTQADAHIPLASPANKQGRIAADHICGRKAAYHATQGTAIAKVFDMTAASTGASERALKAAGIAYESTYTFSAAHATYYPGATSMAIKLLFAPQDGKLLGAQLCGYEGVDKRCDVLATAIRAGMTVYDLTELELAYAPPFSSAKDPVNMAGYVAQNQLEGLVKPFSLDEIAGLDMDAISFVDVRTPGEYRRGTILQAINLPLDEIREHLDELDPQKPVYLFCQIGLRGYLAARILMQHGFDVYNLKGGYRLYSVQQALKD